MKKGIIISFSVSLIITLAIPSLSYFTVLGIQSNLDGEFVKVLNKEGDKIDESFSVTRFCYAQNFTSDNNAMQTICSEIEQFKHLEYWSILVGVFGITVLGFVWLAGFISRRSRMLLVLIFKPGLILMQGAVSFLVLGHGLLLVAAIYYLESYWLGRVHFVLIGGAALISVIAALQIFGSLFSNFKKVEASVFGISLARKDSPKLWALVDEVSKEANTRSPTNLVVGLTPNFFVTAANVRALDGLFTGRTLYLSIPFCRLLSVMELKAIIGHELGHFVGRDTKFSRHFYPIYRGAQNSINILQNHSQGEGGLHTVAILPATFIMSYFIRTFERIEARIGRQRELAADEFAGKICGNDNIASALVKVHAFSSVWPYIENKMVESLAEGRQLVNASLFFEQIATNLPVEFIAEGLGESITEHPTDSHPTLNNRLEALGKILTINLITEVTAINLAPAINVVDNLDEVEQALTEMENLKLSKAHGIDIHEREGVSFELVILRSMISLVIADGNITETELNSIKNIYNVVTKNNLSEDQLSKEIAATKTWKEGLLDYLERAELMLSPTGKGLVLKALLLVAVADGEFHDEEKVLIGKVAAVLKVDNESFKSIANEIFEKAA